MRTALGGPEPDFAHRCVGTLFVELVAEASRGERHLEVNYELASRSRHSQRSPSF
jgi:hypothetical protein